MDAISSAPPAATAVDEPPWTVTVVERAAELCALRHEWDALLDSMPRPSPFLGWDWTMEWWQAFGAGSRLFVLLARDADGRLSGVAPLRIIRRRAFGITPVRTLEFIGYRGSKVCADHLDFLATPADRHAVVSELVAALARRQADWDAAVLADLAEDTLIPPIWQARFGPRQAQRQAETCYYALLPASSEELWQDLRARHRESTSTLLRDRRRLERRFCCRFLAELGPGQVEAAFEDLSRLHAGARGRRGEAGNFWRPEYRRFHRRLAERLAGCGQLYWACLECDQRPVAILYGFVRGRTLYCYQSGFDPAVGGGIGKLLLAFVIEDAVDRLHLREVDLLRGSESYKSYWAPQRRTTATHWAWRSCWRGRVAWLAWRLRQRAVPMRRWAATQLRTAWRPRRRTRQPA